MADDSFFGTEDYEVPSSKGAYMKFEKGENKFRFLSKPILGNGFWIVNAEGKKQPVRMRMTETISVAEVPDGEIPKHFWAAAVWNYATSQVQILEITQKSVQKEITRLTKNPKWGAPTGYDLNVSKSGDGMKTEYAVTPDPKEAVAPEITEAYAAKPVNLEALYDNADPFTTAATQPDVSDVPFG